MILMDFINVAVTALFFTFWYLFGYWSAKRKYRVGMEHITAYRKQLREAKAEAWDEGHNTPHLPEFMGHQFTAVNPYRELGKSGNDFQAKVGIEETE